MKILALVAALALVAVAGAGAVWYLDPFGDSEDDVDLSALTEEFQGSACRQVAGLAAGLAVREPELSPVACLESPDGQLTEEGIEFAEDVIGGDLALDETPQWILENLCRQKTP